MEGRSLGRPSGEGKVRIGPVQWPPRHVTIVPFSAPLRRSGIEPAMRLPLVRTRSLSSARALLLTSLFALLAAAVAPAAAAPVRDAKPAAARRVASTLPDSVLVRIDEREDITSRRFKRAIRILGGDPDRLTPERRDEFLQLVIEQRLLAAAAAASNRPWRTEDSLNFQRDENRILMQSALSHRLERLDAHRRALGQPTLDTQNLGIALRESLMVELAPRFDEALLTRLVPAWQALPVDVDTLETLERIRRMRRLPQPAPDDTLRTVVSTADTSWTVAAVIRGWNRLSPMRRPRVESAAMLRAVIENMIVEDLLTRESREPATRRRPEVAAALADRVEYYAVSAWLRVEVTESIPNDSLTLLAHYKSDPAAFTVPAKARALLLVLERRGEADSLFALLRTPGGATRMQEQAQAQGADFMVELNAAADTLLYGIAARTGVNGVSGPDETPSGWRIMWVESLTSPRLPPFEAVRSEVERSWQGIEGDRRVRIAIEGLERRASIRRNDPALRALVLPATDRRR